MTNCPASNRGVGAPPYSYARRTHFFLKALCGVLLALLLFPAMIAAGNPELTTVLANTRQRIETSDFRATGRLVQVSGNGDRKSYKFSMKARWFPDGLRLLCEITDPAEARVRLLLQMDAHGNATIKVAHPDVAHANHFVVTALPFEKWSDGILGTNFSIEDLAEGQFFWRNQELLQQQKYGARECFVLKSVPAATDKTHYGSITSYLDRQIYYPVYVVKALRGTGVLKDYTYFGLRRSSGVWSANQIEVKTQGKTGSSLLIIERGSAKANLGREDFDLTPP